MKPKILITGNCGFIGSHLQKKMEHDGFDVIGLDNLRWSTQTMHNTVIGDIRDETLVDHLVSMVDEVYHLAAQINVDYGNEHPQETVDINVRGTMNILEACRKYGKKLIFASTSEVYGTAQETYFCHNCKKIVYFPSNVSWSERKTESELEGRGSKKLYKLQESFDTRPLESESEQKCVLQSEVLGHLAKKNDEKEGVEHKNSQYDEVSKLVKNGEGNLPQPLHQMLGDKTTGGTSPDSIQGTNKGLQYCGGCSCERCNLDNGTFNPSVQEMSRGNGFGKGETSRKCKDCEKGLEFISNTINETHPTKAQGVYAASKLGGEALCKAYNDAFNLDVKILRNFNVFGEGQRFDSYGGVIALFVHRALHNKPPIIYGDGEQERDYIYIDDALRGYELAANEFRAGDPVNISTGKTITINRLARLICNYTGCPEPIHTDARPGEVRRLCGDNTKAKKLGFEPLTNFEVMLYNYIDRTRELLHLN